MLLDNQSLVFKAKVSLPKKDQRQKPNYKQQAAEELHRIQEKVILLNEMLLSLKHGEKPDKDDTIVELKNSCINAQPKIQKFVQEEEDSESIGMTIHPLMEDYRYQLMN